MFVLCVCLSVYTINIMLDLLSLSLCLSLILCCKHFHFIVDVQRLAFLPKLSLRHLQSFIIHQKIITHSLTEPYFIWYAPIIIEKTKFKFTIFTDIYRYLNIKIAKSNFLICSEGEGKKI